MPDYSTAIKIASRGTCPAAQLGTMFAGQYPRTTNPPGRSVWRQHQVPCRRSLLASRRCSRRLQARPSSAANLRAIRPRSSPTSLLCVPPRPPPKGAPRQRETHYRVYQSALSSGGARWGPYAIMRRAGGLDRGESSARPAARRSTELDRANLAGFVPGATIIVPGCRPAPLRSTEHAAWPAYRQCTDIPTGPRRRDWPPGRLTRFGGVLHFLP